LCFVEVQFRRPALARILRRESLAATGAGKARRYPRVTVEALQDIVCKGIGPATSNGYLAAAKGFTRWLVKDRRLTSDPRLCLARVTARTDVRRERRALPEDELRAILEVATASTAAIRDLAGAGREGNGPQTWTSRLLRSRRCRAL
jgi:site-specific recombinase XerC